MHKSWLKSRHIDFYAFTHVLSEDELFVRIYFLSLFYYIATR